MGKENKNMSQFDLFEEPLKQLPYSVMPNIPRSVGIPRRLRWVLREGFPFRTVGLSDRSQELLKNGKFEDGRGKGLKFVYEDENGKLKAYLRHKYIGDITYVAFYGITASQTGYRSHMTMSNMTLDETIADMPDFVKNWHTQRLGFEKKKIKKVKK